MRQRLVDIPYRYRIGFTPKGKRNPRPHSVASVAGVAVTELEEQEAPPVVALWRPRLDEVDGEPVEIRHDGLGFLAPVFPLERENNPTRLTAEQLLAALADPKLATTFFGYSPVAIEVGGETPAIPEESVKAVLGPGRESWSAKQSWEIGLAEWVSQFVLIAGRPFCRAPEPVIRIDDYCEEVVNGVRTGMRQLSVRVELRHSGFFTFEGGTRNFRLTHADRATQQVPSFIRPSHEAVNATIDLEVYEPSVFAYDDVTPALGGELIEAGRECVYYSRTLRGDDRRRQEIESLLVRRDVHRGETHVIMWDDPRLPRVAELFRELLEEGLVDPRYTDRVAAAVEGYEGRPGAGRALSDLDADLLGALAP